MTMSLTNDIEHRLELISNMVESFGKNQNKYARSRHGIIRAHIHAIERSSKIYEKEKRHR